MFSSRITQKNHSEKSFIKNLLFFKKQRYIFTIFLVTYNENNILRGDSDVLLIF